MTAQSVTTPSPMPTGAPPKKRMDFDATVDRVDEVVRRALLEDWSVIRELNNIDDPVYLKNSECLLVHVNDAFARTFSPERTPVGRNAMAFLQKSIQEAAQHSDELILAGTTSVQFEHLGHTSLGQPYTFRTHKQSLAEYGNPGIALFGITRAIRPAPKGEAVLTLNVAQKHRMFRDMDETDREISRQIGQGRKVREIAETLGMTPRAVEQHKRKILNALELDQTIDLIKLLVRMQDRGFVDLGL